MKTINTYELMHTQIQTVRMRKDPQILSVDMRRTTPTLTAIEDVNSEPIDRRVLLLLPGHMFQIATPDTMQFLGTMQLADIVYHCFIEKLPEEMAEIPSGTNVSDGVQP